MVGYFLSAQETGFFQVAAQISSGFAIIGAAMSKILAPTVALLYAQKEEKVLARIFRVSVRWSLYLVIPLLIIVLVASQEIVVFLYGLEYLDSSDSLAILSVAQLINIISVITGFFLMMTNYIRQWMWVLASAFFMNFVFGLWLIPLFGSSGAALVNALVAIWILFLSLLVLQKKLHIKAFDKNLGKTFLAGIITWGISCILPVDSFFLLAAIILVGFVGCLALFKWDKEDQVFLAMLRKRMGRNYRA